MQYEFENERLADTSACAGVRADLKMCLLQSDCCKKVRIASQSKSLYVCAYNPNNLQLSMDTQKLLLNNHFIPQDSRWVSIRS